MRLLIVAATTVAVFAAKGEKPLTGPEFSYTDNNGLVSSEETGELEVTQTLTVGAGVNKLTENHDSGSEDYQPKGKKMKQHQRHLRSSKCKARNACVVMGGYCVTNGTSCGGRLVPEGCKGSGCQCCVPGVLESKINQLESSINHIFYNISSMLRSPCENKDLEARTTDHKMQSFSKVTDRQNDELYNFDGYGGNYLNRNHGLGNDHNHDKEEKRDQQQGNIGRPTCKARNACVVIGGYCVTNASLCRGRLVPEGCKRPNCQCCVPGIFEEKLNQLDHFISDIFVNISQMLDSHCENKAAPTTTTAPTVVYASTTTDALTTIALPTITTDLTTTVAPTTSVTPATTAAPTITATETTSVAPTTTAATKITAASTTTATPTTTTAPITTAAPTTTLITTTTAVPTTIVYTDISTTTVSPTTTYLPTTSAVPTTTTQIPGCGGVFNSNTGTIRYPPNGGNYQNNENCGWLIRAGVPITIIFTSFATENCCDRLKVFNGENANSHKLGEFKGSVIPSPILVTSNAAYLQFTSDHSIISTGFTIQWKPTVYWPSGRYSMPRPSGGCPDSSQFTWAYGWTKQATETGHNYHSSSYMSSSSYETSVYKYYCTKTSSSTGSGSWPRGDYCIYRYGGSCPSGFNSGYIMWDDADARGQGSSRSGTVPDGTYNYYSTLLRYCCRSDGSSSTYIKLPTEKTFILMMNSHYGCQRVSGMNYRIQYITINTEDGSGNDSYLRGDYPYTREYSGASHTYGSKNNADDPRIYYCYYY